MPHRATLSRRVLTAAQARRIALAAQGLGATRAHTRASRASFRRYLNGAPIIQIDSVNVLARAHLLPAFARLGAYDVGLFDEAVAQGELIEYWAHVASFIPAELFDVFGFRQREYAASQRWHIAGVAPTSSPVTARVRELLAARGPATARELHVHFEHEFPRKYESWGWNWSIAKHVCEYLYRTGEVGVAGRTPSFERRYDLIERLPLHRSYPLERAAAHKVLVERAARAHGVGTVRCFAHYFYLSVSETAAAVAALVAEGVLEPVAVSGWTAQAFVHAEARVPHRLAARALLAPFDPVVWDRRRLLGLFGMHYRIGIYTPAAQRTHGYYVLPFVLGDQLVARVDLKADRAGSRLLVRQLTLEDGQELARVGPALVAELTAMATWLGMADLVQEVGSGPALPL